VGDGYSERPNYFGVRIRDRAAGVTVGGTNINERNIISRNIGSEVWLEGPSGGHRILGNYIGLDVEGVSYAGLSSGYLVHIDNSSSNIIGGTITVGRNAMGSSIDGIMISGTGSFANVVSGNLIGTDYSGTETAGIYYWAVAIRNASNNRIGGSVQEMNVIAYSGGGILVTNTAGTNALGNALGINLIYSNSPMPNIDLGGDGLTANDSLDADSGPNLRQNRPAVGQGLIVGGSVYLQGVLTSAPSQTFAVDLYKADDNKTNAGSRIYIGRAPVTTDAGGVGTFAAGFGINLATGAYITATATDANGNTSEFARSLTGLVVQVVADTDGDGIPDYWETLYGLNPGVSNASTDDADSDGVPDLGEYFSDTAANNSNLFFKITSITNSGARYVSFPTKSTRYYEIESIFQLNGTQSWNSLISGLPGIDADLSWSDNGSNTMLLFRVKSSLP